MAAAGEAELAQATSARFVGNPNGSFAQWNERVRVLRVEADGRVLIVTGAEEQLFIAPGEGYFAEADGPLPGGVPTSELAPGPAVVATEQGGGAQ
jgi:hypothetical protein